MSPWRLAGQSAPGAPPIGAPSVLLCPVVHHSGLEGAACLLLPVMQAAAPAGAGALFVGVAVARLRHSPASVQPWYAVMAASQLAGGSARLPPEVLPERDGLRF